MAKLTDKDIRDLTVPEGAKDIQAFDDELPGFGVRKFASGKTSLSTLSASSSDVRRLVRGLLARCRPSARKQPWSWLKPGSARMSSERLGAQQQAANAKTLDKLVGPYLELREKGDEFWKAMRPRTHVEATRYLQRSWRPLHDKPVNEITRQMVRERRNEIVSESGAVSANRALAALSGFCGWAITEEHVSGTNPTSDIKPLHEHGRERVLSAEAFSELGRFDEALGHAETAVRIAEAIDHSHTLSFGLLLRRGDFPRATRVLERGLDLLRRTSQDVIRTPLFTAALGTAYALAGRFDKALPLRTSAVDAFRRCQMHNRPAHIFLCAGVTSLAADQIDEAASHAREALALTRRLGARGSEAHALCLAGDIASVKGSEDAEGCYRQALTLAEARGMRPLVAHCKLGLGKLYGRQGNRGHAQEHLTTAIAMYREMGMTYWPEQAEEELRQLG